MDLVVLFGLELSDGTPMGKFGFVVIIAVFPFSQSLGPTEFSSSPRDRTNSIHELGGNPGKRRNPAISFGGPFDLSLPIQTPSVKYFFKK
jgi:hypothetical protein